VNSNLNLANMKQYMANILYSEGFGLVKSVKEKNAPPTVTSAAARIEDRPIDHRAAVRRRSSLPASAPRTGPEPLRGLWARPTQSLQGQWARGTEPL
jgi:hypothetical protein